MSGSKSGSLKSADEKIATVGAVNTGWDYSHGFGGQLKGENNGKTTVTATYYDWNDNSEKKYDF